MGGLGVDLMSALVQVDLLHAKGEGLAAFEVHKIHAEDFCIKIDRGIDVRHGKDKMVKLIQGEGHMVGMIVLHSKGDEGMPRELQGRRI